MEVHLFFLIAWSSLLSTCTLCLDPEVAERPRCNLTLSSLTSLRNLFNNSAGQTANETAVICVDLLPVEEYLNYTSDDISAAAVIITGSTDGTSVVRCHQDPELGLNEYSVFPLIFTNTGLVVVERVLFEGCQRPLHFIEVTRVEVVSSTFRYVPSEA